MNLRRRAHRALTYDALCAGTIAGVAMIPFGLVFRSLGLRINEYGPKTLALVFGEVHGAMLVLLALIQHFLISWVLAVPLLMLLDGIAGRGPRVLIGAAHGVAAYVVVNTVALPFAFRDPTPWSLGFRTVYPSLVVHVVYGIAVALTEGTGTTLRPVG